MVERGRVPAADQPHWLTARLRGIGDRIRQAREQRGWSQELLAERADVSRSTIQRAESGGNVSMAQLLKIARAMRVSVTDLFG